MELEKDKEDNEKFSYSQMNISKNHRLLAREIANLLACGPESVMTAISRQWMGWCYVWISLKMFCVFFKYEKNTRKVCLVHDFMRMCMQALECL